MIRYLFLVLAALTMGVALLAPGTWSPFVGPLQFAGDLPVRDATRGPPLPLALVSQYQGLATDNANCGPAAIAAILRYALPGEGAVKPAALVAAVRERAGAEEGDTTLGELADALAQFGIASAMLSPRDGDGDALSAIALALQQGRPVLALVSGVPLGRGEGYGNHFIVVTGMDARSGRVTVIDPDTQQPRTAAWRPGGEQQWPAALLQEAMVATGAASGLPALAIDAERGPAPISRGKLLLASTAVFAVLILTAGREPARRRRVTGTVAGQPPQLDASLLRRGSGRIQPN